MLVFVKEIELLFLLAIVNRIFPQNVLCVKILLMLIVKFASIVQLVLIVKLFMNGMNFLKNVSLKLLLKVQLGVVKMALILLAVM
jgi:hypothetical protein